MTTTAAIRSSALDGLQQFDAVRRRTVALARPLSEEDCCAQSMPDASPIKWHLAHTTWFFETFILERFEPNFAPYHPAFRMLFNSYYNGIGDKHVRAQRGLLTRPAFDEVLAYRHDVDARIGRLCERADNQDYLPQIMQLLMTGLQHEQQHQELMLTDIKHLLSCNPLQPAYCAEPLPVAASLENVPTPEWHSFAAGTVHIGHRGEGFCFDSETPAHRQFTEAFSIAARLVSNAEYLAFVKDGGYRNPALWLAEGWDWLQANQLTRPLYWQTENWQTESTELAGNWYEFTLHGLLPLDPQRPVTHLSYFEAEAFARWAGARLPTEAEWERAAASYADDGARGLHPSAPVLREASMADANGAHNAGQCAADWFGACWQWTSSSYAPYPGYAPAAGAIGEYNGKFMVNQYVLRGSSCATPVGHSRPTYRNFFPATARWQFSGIRLAKS